ncbi:MAG TPA: hypothetical protein PLU30_25540 [Verrucomicrobiae bacterium]|nr:hypothetical protein [Verrucomicrobiae bacterium]
MLGHVTAGVVADGDAGIPNFTFATISLTCSGLTCEYVLSSRAPWSLCPGHSATVRALTTLRAVVDRLAGVAEIGRRLDAIEGLI